MMMLLLRPPAARCELRGIAKPAALKDQEFRAALVLLAPIPRACEGRAEPATSVSRATHNQVVSGATRDQADPLAPAGRRLAAVPTSF
jgi:hypothetical protein